MLNFGRLSVLTIVCCVAAPLYAQTVSNAHRTFVDVSLGPNWDDLVYVSTRAPGATLGAGLALGFDRGRWGAELDVVVPQWHVKTWAPQRYLYAGRSFGYEQQGHSYESLSTQRRRSIEVMALYRVNVTVNPRATFTGLAGGGYVYRPDEDTVVVKEVLPDGQLSEVYTNESASSRNYLAAAARLDLAIRVAPRVSVVPRLRVTLFPSLLDDSGLAPRMLMARPEVAVRWAF